MMTKKYLRAFFRTVPTWKLVEARTNTIDNKALVPIEGAIILETLDEVLWERGKQ